MATIKIDSFSTDVIRAREEGTLDKLLPSGTEIPIEFSDGWKNTLIVGRDEAHTYLITQDCIPMNFTWMNAAATNTGGWVESDMRKRMGTIYELLPESIREAIIPLHIEQCQLSEIYESADMAFLLSAINVFGGDSKWLNPNLCFSKDYYSSQIDIFRISENRIKHRAGEREPVTWWLRTPHYIDYFFCVHPDGKLGARRNNDELDIAVGFCIEDRSGATT